MPGNGWKHVLAADKTPNGNNRHGNRHLIHLQQVVETYQATAGTFTALM